MNSTLEQDAAVDADDLLTAFDGFIPPSYLAKIEMENFAAVSECTSRSLLPAKYRLITQACQGMPPGSLKSRTRNSASAARVSGRR
jgi:hypothetical protein